ncbi:MAG: GIY-YIG nuclease family protein, partial [Endozoicomonas sp.]
MMNNSSESWFVYIILASDNSLYTGITTDIKRRWRQHSGDLVGGARFFRGRKPEKLVYVEKGNDRS